MFEEAKAALQTAIESGQAQRYLSGDEKVEFTTAGFCAWHTAERVAIEQRLRAQIVKEIEEHGKRLSPECHVFVAMFARVARGEL